MVTVRGARVTDRPVLAEVLARAFAEDPVIRWVLPNPSRDRKLFRALAARAHAVPGYADLAFDGDTAVGAALWDPPGHRLAGMRLVAAYAAMTRAMGLGLRRGMLMEKAYSEHQPPGTFHYLAQLRASPQGQGAGSALLKHRLSRLDGPAYLESSHPANVPFYQRFGFQMTEEFTLPEDGPPVWGMLRKQREIPRRDRLVRRRGVAQGLVTDRTSQKPSAAPASPIATEAVT